VARSSIVRVKLILKGHVLLYNKYLLADLHRIQESLWHIAWLLGWRFVTVILAKIRRAQKLDEGRAHCG
jgi:hypothetical protein